MATLTDRGLYPAEHRGLRELHASVRFLAGHWARLAQRTGSQPLHEGAAAARDLLDELRTCTERYGLEVVPAAQAGGARVANLRNGVGDRLLERNQALRAAVLEIQHVVTLLGYLGELAEHRGDGELTALHRRWETRLRAIEDAARAAAVATGGDPDAAVAPADPSPAGRAGHRVGYALGALGETIDASAVGRLARRLTGRGAT